MPAIAWATGFISIFFVGFIRTENPCRPQRRSAQRLSSPRYHVNQSSSQPTTHISQPVGPSTRQPNLSLQRTRLRSPLSGVSLGGEGDVSSWPHAAFPVVLGTRQSGPHPRPDRQHSPSSD